MKVNYGSHEYGRKDATPGSGDEMELKELTRNFKAFGDEIKGFAEKAEKEIKAGGELSRETKTKVDELLTKQADADGRMREIEEKLEKGFASRVERKTAGQMVIENEAVKAMKSTTGGRAQVEVKALITDATTDAPGSAGDLLTPYRVPGIVAAPDRRMTVRDLLTPGRVGAGVSSIEYVRDVGFTNNAAVVPAGQQKPQSDIQFTQESTRVATIAHWVQATRQILDDALMLRSYIDGRLRYGLQYKEEEQFLKGNGAGGNLTGIFTLANEYAPAFAPEMPTMIDTLRLAILQASLAEYSVTGIVLNPVNWTQIELTKTTDGAYLFANPQSLAGPVLWGRPIVETQALNEGEFLTGAFKLGAQIFDREDASVVVSTEDRDNFIKNLVTVLAEERVGLAVYRPEAFVKGTFEYFTG